MTIVFAQTPPLYLDRKVSAQSEDSAAESGIGHETSEVPSGDRSRCGSTTDSAGIPMVGFCIFLIDILLEFRNF